MRDPDLSRSFPRPLLLALALATLAAVLVAGKLGQSMRGALDEVVIDDPLPPLTVTEGATIVVELPPHRELQLSTPTEVAIAPQGQGRFAITGMRAGEVQLTLRAREGRTTRLYRGVVTVRPR